MPSTQTPFDRQVAAVRPKVAGPTRAQRTIILEPAEFAYDYRQKPSTPIVVGLRQISTADAERALGFAEMEAKSPEARRHAVGVFCAARGICDPNDIEKPHPSFECAEDLLPIALSQPTIERILAEMADLVVKSGTLDSEADEDEARQLGMMLSVDDPFQHVEPSRAAMARRHIRFALNEMLDGYTTPPIPSDPE